MPHLTMEYSRNLHAEKLAPTLLALNRRLLDSGHFEELDIKSRAIALDQFLVGTVPEGRAFVHVKLALLSGRTEQVKRELAEGLLAVLQHAYAEEHALHLQLCVEIQEIERASYAKVTFSC